jgi:hypothetical protein
MFRTTRLVIAEQFAPSRFIRAASISVWAGRRGAINSRLVRFAVLSAAAATLFRRT